MDAFFASVEQRDKPSLRGKPVIVGGVGPRGVVSTASYEARKFGVHSAMATAEARRRCPHAAYLSGRSTVYREVSAQVMAVLRTVSPVVEPLSLDEAFVDLSATSLIDVPADDATVRHLAEEIRAAVFAETQLTASVGVGTSKFLAKLATNLCKPDGCRVIAPGSETELLAPMSVGVIPGVGPATKERLSRIGIRTIADLRHASPRELERELGHASATTLIALAHGRDNRPVEASRDAKSISVEDTFEHDETDPEVLTAVCVRDAGEVAGRLQKARMFARTITVKVRLADFTTLSRSHTLHGATDAADRIAQVACRLLDGIDLSTGVRLLGVGVSGFSTAAQEELFGAEEEDIADAISSAPVLSAGRSTPGLTTPGLTTHERRRSGRWRPGADVIHDRHGRGWVWGAGRSVVTVRFETADTGPGPVRSFAIDDPELRAV